LEEVLSGMVKTPRWYQQEAFDSVWQFISFHGPMDRPLIAMPTGTGKSFVIAMIIKYAMQFTGTRIASFVHVKELIKQNSEELLELWPAAQVGIYSDGLKQRNAEADINFSSINSIYKKAELLGHRDIVIVDEAHLISNEQDSMYNRAFKTLLAINPNMRIIGLTATPFRTKSGMLINGLHRLFTDICYDLTGVEPINRLIREGFLCKLVTKRTDTFLSTKEVRIVAGEFKKAELEKAVDTDNLNNGICQEIVAKGADRLHWLVFASGVDHAEHLAKILREMGVPTQAVHSKISDNLRDQYIEEYKAGKLRCLVTNNMLTTGFDFPAIDLIAMCRPSMSPGLHVQMNGRGFRPFNTKINCLVLDFAGNIARLGPVNDPKIPSGRKGESSGTPPIRICPNCGSYQPANAKFCDDCGFEFPKLNKLTYEASQLDIIKSDAPEIEWFRVDRVLYSRRKFNQKPAMLQVDYVCGIRRFTEWVMFDHEGAPRIRAGKWWKYRADSLEAPPNTDEALNWTRVLTAPRRIQVNVNRKYPEVVRWDFLGNIIDEWSKPAQEYV
jgi:DNA repair protein RadD